MECEQNELADYGYDRDGKKGKQQIVIGLLTGVDGEPLAARVFEGNTADPSTVGEQIDLLKQQFAGLAVADDELALSAADGDHGVDRLDAGRKRSNLRMRASYTVGSRNGSFRLTGSSISWARGLCLTLPRLSHYHARQTMPNDRLLQLNQRQDC